MDLLLTTVLCFGIIVGYKAQQSGRVNYSCREGEDYYTCQSPCEPSCDGISRGSRVNCTGPCIAGCFCRNGLVRAIDNSCVPPEDCFLPSCQENEEFNECGSPCEMNCTNLNDGIFCTKPCYRGCFCKPGFVRDANRQCVPPRNCYIAGTQQCGSNQRYVQCVSFCNTCWEFNYCAPSFCQPGCDCIPGFYKNFYGQCVSANECYSMYGNRRTCEENEEYSSCINNCNDCYFQGRCPYPQYYCESGCDCKRGFFRNDRGVCVPRERCYRQECGVDEVYVECGPSCRTSCENYKQHIYEPCRRDCVPGCVCRGNRVVGPDGTCIKPESCPRDEQPNCPVNETYYVCKPTCRNTCENFNDTNLICDMSCTSGCFCVGGLVRRNDGTCVPPRECVSASPPIRCPPGQEYHECLPTCRVTCENYNSSICTKICVPGCSCPRGLVKRRDGMCVQPRDCEIVCGLNEEFTECGTACPLTCANWNQRRVCSQRCVKGCFCRSGFIFNPDGLCIRPSNCPRTTPCATPDTTSFEGRRGVSGEDNSSDSISTTQAPTQTEMPDNITEKSETIKEGTTITESNSTESRTLEASTAVSTATPSSDTQSSTTLSALTTATVSPPQVTQKRNVNDATTSPTTNATEINPPITNENEETSIPRQPKSEESFVTSIQPITITKEAPNSTQSVTKNGGTSLTAITTVTGTEETLTGSTP